MRPRALERPLEKKGRNARTHVYCRRRQIKLLKAAADGFIHPIKIHSNFLLLFLQTLEHFQIVVEINARCQIWIIGDALAAIRR